MLKKRKYRYIIIKVIEVEDVKEIILKLTEQEKEELFDYLKVVLNIMTDK